MWEALGRGLLGLCLKMALLASMYITHYITHFIKILKSNVTNVNVLKKTCIIHILQCDICIMTNSIVESELVYPGIKMQQLLGGGSG